MLVCKSGADGVHFTEVYSTSHLKVSDVTGSQGQIHSVQMRQNETVMFFSAGTF